MIPSASKNVVLTLLKGLHFTLQFITMPCLQPEGRGRGSSQTHKMENITTSFGGWLWIILNDLKMEGKSSWIERKGVNQLKWPLPDSYWCRNLFTLQCLAANMAAPAPFKSEVFTPSPKPSNYGPVSLCLATITLTLLLQNRKIHTSSFHSNHSTIPTCFSILHHWSTEQTQI